MTDDPRTGVPSARVSSGLTRREFVVSASVAGLAAIATPSLARSTRRDTTPLKVGLIGCGGRGTGAAANAIEADPNAVIWSMGDLFPERVRTCAVNLSNAIGDERTKSQMDLGDRVYAGFNAFRRVLESGVDVVLLATPPAFRPEHFVASVNAGKHVFCEKPVAVDPVGVRMVMESARDAKARGLSVMSGFCWRYQDQVKEAFQKIADGGVGRVNTVLTTYNTTGWVQPKPRQQEWSDTEFQIRNWHYFHPLSGDHIVEQAVHAIDWISWAKGDVPPLSCVAVGGRTTRPDLPETGNVWDNFSVNYQYEDGTVAQHMCRHWPNTPSDNTATVIGSKGICRIKPWQGLHTIEGETPWRGRAAGNDMYLREHEVLFRSIRDKAPVNDGDRMCTTTMLAIMGRQAAYTGEVVTWDQIMNAGEVLNPREWGFGPRPVPARAVPGITRMS